MFVIFVINNKIFDFGYKKIKIFKEYVLIKYFCL